MRLSWDGAANDSVLMEVASTQLGAMPPPRSRSWAVRGVILTYGAFSLILLATYTANLTAFQTVRLRNCTKFVYACVRQCDARFCALIARGSRVTSGSASFPSETTTLL